LKKTKTYYPQLEDAIKAPRRLQDIASLTPLHLNEWYSEEFACFVYFKREDLQTVCFCKIRGAFNKISTLKAEETANGIVCASAGNYAQGVAMSCKLLKIPGTIYMPSPTPVQKIKQVKMHGGRSVEVVLHGDSFDDA
jgi:threonine dehydratase